MAGSIRVVVRVRTLDPSGLNPPQIRVIDRLQTLTIDGPVDELDVDSWGATMGITQTDNRNLNAERERLIEFKHWADQRGCTLRPAFNWHSTDTASEQQLSTKTVTPLITVAVYRGEELQAVYPHMREGEKHLQTVHDGIEALESMPTEAQRIMDEQRDPGTLATPPR